MFRKIRQKDLKKVLWVLVILIVPAFTFWGASWFIKQKDRFIAKIYGRKITPDEYQGLIHNFQVFFLLSFGRDFLGNIKAQELENYLWQNLLLIEKAKKENISVTNKEVADKIKTFAFLNAEGSFSKERYLAILKSLRVVPGQFEEFLKDLIKAEKLTEMVLSAVEATEDEIKQKYKEENEEAKIKYIFIDFDSFKDKKDIPREELEDFFRKNSEEFRIPPKVKIAYVLIKDPASEVIDGIQQEIQQETDLDQIAKKFGLEITESGFFSSNDPIEGLGWQNQIAARAFESEKESIRGPFATTEGMVFFKKLDFKQTFIPEFSEVAEQVKEKLISVRAHQAAKQRSEEIISAIKEKNLKDLEEAKKIFPELELAQSVFFKRQDYLEKIGLNVVFNNKVFSLDANQILLEAVELEKGFCVAQLLEFKPLDEEKFNQEKEVYRAKILGNKRIMMMNSYLAQLIKEGNFSLAQQTQTEE